MKTWNEINVEEVLSLEDFLMLFSKAPLLDEERAELPEYHKVYETFVGAEVKPKDAWVATRNIFVVKNMQIGDRIKANQSTLKIVK